VRHTDRVPVPKQYLSDDSMCLLCLGGEVAHVLLRMSQLRPTFARGYLKETWKVSGC
jgi:hypothetical protein